MPQNNPSIINKNNNISDASFYNMDRELLALKKQLRDKMLV